MDSRFRGRKTRNYSENRPTGIPRETKCRGVSVVRRAKINQKLTSRQTPSDRKPLDDQTGATQEISVNIYEHVHLYV